MNAMGHNIPNMIGVDHRGIAQKIQKLVPDYMVMGERGMADMGEMEMPIPDNTLPMMTGKGPYGAMEMGGMFTVVKIREGLGAQRLQGPGLVQAARRVRRVRMDRQHAARAANPQPRRSRLRRRRHAARAEYRVRKPCGHAGH